MNSLVCNLEGELTYKVNYGVLPPAKWWRDLCCVYPPIWYVGLLENGDTPNSWQFDGENAGVFWVMFLFKNKFINAWIYDDLWMNQSWLWSIRSTIDQSANRSERSERSPKWPGRVFPIEINRSKERTGRKVSTNTSPMFQQQQSVPFFDKCPVIHPMNIISGCVDLIRSCLIMFSWYNTHTQIGCFFGSVLAPGGETARIAGRGGRQLAPCLADLLWTAGVGIAQGRKGWKAGARNIWDAPKTMSLFNLGIQSLSKVIVIVFI